MAPINFCVLPKEQTKKLRVLLSIPGKLAQMHRETGLSTITIKRAKLGGQVVSATKDTIIGYLEKSES